MNSPLTFSSNPNPLQFRSISSSTSTKFFNPTVSSSQFSSISIINRRIFSRSSSISLGIKPSDGASFSLVAGARVSSSGASTCAVADGGRVGGGGGEVEMPGFVEFVTSERVKVVIMLALALALCNADRVVMSVAIVPLSLSNGWSKSFAGVVQVHFFLQFELFFMKFVYVEVISSNFKYCF